MESLEVAESPQLQLLHGLVAAGSLSFVDEDGQPLTFAQAYEQRCWAHMRNAEDGEVYVQELAHGHEILALHYLDKMDASV